LYGTNGTRECPFYHYSTTSEMESMIGTHKFKYGNSSAETKKKPIFLKKKTLKRIK
jgi:hypothetical protein